MIKTHVCGLREVETKTGKNAGQKNLFFTVVFQFTAPEGEYYFAGTGFRLWNGKILPPATRLGQGFMNLNYFDRDLCMNIANNLEKKLLEEKLPYTLSHPLEDAIKNLVLKKSDLKRLAPDLELKGKQ